MTCGKRRHRIEIQTATETSPESGQVSRTWGFFAYRYASVKTATGREFFGHDKLNAQVDHVVNVRWCDGVTGKMRVLWGTRVLNIVHVSEDDKHKNEMWLYCKEKKS